MRSFYSLIFSVLVLASVASAGPLGRIPTDPAFASLYRVALEDYDAGRNARAHAAFTELAKQRVVEAQFMLGVMSEFGDGVPVSYYDAVDWYRTAAEAGLASAQNRLGMLYANGIGVAPDRKKAEYWLRKAAGQADATALNELGAMKASGRGDTQSRQEAYAYYWLAAQAGFEGASAKVDELAALLRPAELVAARNRTDELRAQLTIHGDGETAERSRAFSEDGEALALRRTSIRDPKMKADSGMLLVPNSWVVEGGIVWDRHAAHLAAPWIVVSDPKASGVAEIFPPRAFKWEDGGVEFSPIGTLRRGYEVRPPIDDAALFVESIVLVRERSNRSDLRVVEREAFPAVAAAMVEQARRQGVRTAADAARVRVAYAEDGVEIEEDFYCVLGRVDGNMMGGAVFWGPKVLVSVRAPAGELDRLAGLLLSVATSYRVDRKWHDRYRQIMQMWNQGRGNSTPRENTLDMYVGAVSFHETPASRQAYESAATLEWGVLGALADSASSTRLEDDPAGAGQLAVPITSTSVSYSADGTYRLTYRDVVPVARSPKKRGGAQFDVISAEE